MRLGYVNISPLPIQCNDQPKGSEDQIAPRSYHILNNENNGEIYTACRCQYFIFTDTSLTTTSFARGKCGRRVCSLLTLAPPSYSSRIGGLALRGTMPGSLPEVSRRVIRTWEYVFKTLGVQGWMKKIRIIVFKM